MKPVSIQTQRRIMRLPIVNAATMFICVYNHYAVPQEKNHSFRCVAYMMGYGVPAAIAYMVLYRLTAALVPALAPVVYGLAIYLVPLVLSYGLIRYQEKYLFEKAV